MVYIYATEHSPYSGTVYTEYSTGENMAKKKEKKPMKFTEAFIFGFSAGMTIVASELFSILKSKR